MSCCRGNLAPCLSMSCFCFHRVLQVFEKFTKESTSLLDELSIINDSDKSSAVDKDKYARAHAHRHARRCSLGCINTSWTVCLCSAGQQIVPPCRPLTLRLSFRRVDFLFSYLNRSLLCLTHKYYVKV